MEERRETASCGEREAEQVRQADRKISSDVEIGRMWKERFAERALVWERFRYLALSSVHSFGFGFCLTFAPSNPHAHHVLTQVAHFFRLYAF